MYNYTYIHTSMPTYIRFIHTYKQSYMHSYTTNKQQHKQNKTNMFHNTHTYTYT